MHTPAPDRYDTMQYHRSGESGLKLPAVSLGLWHNFGDTARYDNMKAICLTAFDHGITHFDLANNYGPEPGAAEKNFGRILREELGAHRHELLISTKAGYLMWPGPYGDFGSRKYLLTSLDQSLQRMGLDYVDIFYHHRMDPDTPLEETMGALDQAVKSGKALYAGLSNYDGPTLEKATAILKELHCPFVINQNRYSIFDRTIEKNGLKDTAVRLGKGIIAFSPLAQGLLTDRYLHGIPEDSRMRTDGRFLKDNALTPGRLAQITALNDLAARRGESLATMALKWILRTRRDQRAGGRQPSGTGAGRPEGAEQPRFHRRRTGHHRSEQLIQNNKTARRALRTGGRFVFLFMGPSIAVDDGVLDGEGSVLPGQTACQGQGKGNGGAQGFAGDDVAVHRQRQAGILGTGCGEGFVHTGIDGGTLAFQQAEGGQHGGGGTDGGHDLAVGSHAGAGVLDGFAGLEVVYPRNAAGQDDRVKGGIIQLFGQGVSHHIHLTGGTDGALAAHGGNGHIHTGTAQDVHTQKALALFQAGGKKDHGFAHRGSLLL